MMATSVAALSVLPLQGPLHRPDDTVSHTGQGHKSTGALRQSGQVMVSYTASVWMLATSRGPAPRHVSWGQNHTRVALQCPAHGNHARVCVSGKSAARCRERGRGQATKERVRCPPGGTIMPAALIWALTTPKHRLGLLQVQGHELGIRNDSQALVCALAALAHPPLLAGPPAPLYLAQQGRLDT